jgi:hypothetical protein
MSAFSKKLGLVVFTLLLIAFFLVRPRPAPRPPVVSNSGERISQEMATQVARLEARERTMDKTVWAKEILAQECGRTFEALWDSLNAATNKLALAASFAAGHVVLGKWTSPKIGPHGIQVHESAGLGRELDPREWRHFVEEFDRAGWQLAQTEFRHNRFETDETGQPRQSHFYFAAQLANSQHNERALLEGNLVVDWGAAGPPGEPHKVNRIDTSRLTLKTRRGEPPFECVLLDQIKPPENAYSIDPLIVYDLDGDGLSEIILAAKNLVYRRPDKDRFQPEALCRYPPGLISTALIADFDGDGAADFLCQKQEGLALVKGTPRGTFEERERMVWPAPMDLKYPMVLTCGDIDHDGDLDVFIGQYKVPYEGGSLPTPFYDANDGYPAYLLLNDGAGNLSDATEAAGFTRKRSRRSYSASFVDLDGDSHLDLVVISDFAGVDIYRNDGRGRFADVTRQWVAAPRAFGMAHALADFNADGRLDLLMMGMTSPTANRLEHLGLSRGGLTEDRSMRSSMTLGNRLYLARSEGGFEQTPLSDSITRSGWSWGCSAFDFDNNGFPDVYVANGLESRQSVRDYESEYWLHDRYVGNSEAEPVAYLYFKSKFARTRGRGQSYGGHERNRFYLNQQGASFLEAGHLLGVGLEQDSRNVVSDDLDGDGRMDLLVTSFEAWPEPKQTLRIYKNALNEGGNWIGFRFPEGPKSAVGVRVTLRYGGHSAVREIVNGDSHRAQHAATLHFGLGEADRIDNVEIRWPNGGPVTLREPALNRYHVISEFPSRGN